VITYFADTFYFLALLNADDQANAAATRWASRPSGPLITTYWVLTEVADAMSAPASRHFALTLISCLRRNPAVEILPPDLDLFDCGLDVYARRPDKAWSLTDCISFVETEAQLVFDSSCVPVSAPQNHLQEGCLIPGLRKRPRPRSFPGSRLVAFAGRGSPSRSWDHPHTHNRTVVMPGSRWGRKPVRSEAGEVRPSFKLTCNSV